MSISDDIKIIAKTDFLEKKIGQALASTETATPTAGVYGETSTAFDNIAELPTTTNDSTIGPADATSAITIESTPDGKIIQYYQDGFLIAQWNKGSSGGGGGPPNPGGGGGSGGTVVTGGGSGGIVTDPPINWGNGPVGGGTGTGGTGQRGGGAGGGAPAGNGGSPSGGTDSYNHYTGGLNPVTTSTDDNGTAGGIESGIFTTFGGNLSDPPLQYVPIQIGYSQNQYGTSNIWGAQQIVQNAPGTPNLQTDPNGLQGSLNGVIGSDPAGNISSITGTTLSVLLLLGLNNTSGGSIYPTPSPGDCANAYPPQNPWADANTPPVRQSYTAGKIWALEHGASTLIAQTFYDLVALGQSSIAAHVYSYNSGTGLVTSVGTPQVGDNILFSGNGSGTVGTSTASLGGTEYTQGLLGVGHYGQYACGTVSGDTSVCALAPPVEKAWPKTGLVVRSLYLGVFTTSPYDQEAPSYMNYPSSSAILNVPDGTYVAQNPKYLFAQSLLFEAGIDGGTLVSHLSSTNAQGQFFVGTFYNNKGIMTDTIATPNQAAYYKNH